MSGDDAPPGLPVLATYLHVSPETFRPTYVDLPGVTIVECPMPSVAFYRFLYDSVGRHFSWVDRLRWSDDELQAYLTRPEVTILVLYVDGAPAGYAELLTVSEEPGTEVKYFGIFPECHGRGLGKHLLSFAVQCALDAGATRVWLSTRTTDGLHAIANYEARGFVAYRTEWEPAPLHPDNRS